MCQSKIKDFIYLQYPSVCDAFGWMALTGWTSTV